jgi:hypothetical protein
MSFVKSNVPFFGPRQVPGLVLWLDASDSTTVSLSNNNVTRWNDKSGRNNNATPFGTGSPTYSSNSIVFTGTQAFATTLQSLMSNQSGFAIVRYSSAAKINIISVNRTSGTAAIQQIIQTNVQRITIYGGSNIATGATLTQNTMLLYNYTFSATSNAFLYVNGSQTGTSTGPYNFTGAGTINIGGYDSTPGEGFVGSMNEILLYSNVLTTSQRQQVEGHLAWKWGLQANLPAGHPYRFNSQQTLYPFTTIQTPFINIIKPYYSDFSPRSISGCRLWLDAADATTITLSNGTVAQWTDKSGLSNNATQAVGSNQPGYSNSFVSLNGVNQFFNVNLDFLAGVSHNSFIVLRNFNFTNIYGAATGGLGANSLHIGFNSAGAYRMNYWGNDLYPAITANYKVNQVNLLNFNWVNNTGKIIYANGGLEISSNQPGIIGTMAGGGRIGNVANSTGVFNPAFINANIYEMIIYTGTLTTNQRQQIEGYLASKWGILGSLASSNPFRGNIRKLIFPNIDISRPPVYSVSRNNVRWIPTQISGCALWLDAADRAGITLTGSNITNVNDKSGQNVVLSNATGFSYATNIFNGKYPSFYNPNGGFARGTTARLGQNASFAIGVPFTVFFVGHDITTSDFGYIIDSGPSGLNRPYIYDPRLITLFGNTGITQTARSPFQGCSQFYNSPTMFVNGSSAYTAGSLTAFTTGGITVGNRFSLNEAWPGHICEIIIYNRSIITRERQQVEGYLAYKWGLRSLLPANHPYKNIPVS